MSNGRIDEAEIDALLASDQRLIDKYLVTGMRELRKGQHELKSEVSGMRQVCETRGLMCPGVHDHGADPAQPVPTAGPPSEDRRTWAMWGVGTTLLREFVLPIVLVLATLAITGKL